MAKITIYVPDDLSQCLRQHGSINISAICQGALWAYLQAVEQDPDPDLQGALDVLHSRGMAAVWRKDYAETCISTAYVRSQQ